MRVCVREIERERTKEREKMRERERQDALQFRSGSAEEDLERNHN